MKRCRSLPRRSTPRGKAIASGVGWNPRWRATRDASCTKAPRPVKMACGAFPGGCRKGQWRICARWRRVSRRNQRRYLSEPLNNRHPSCWRHRRIPDSRPEKFCSLCLCRLAGVAAAARAWLKEAFRRPKRWIRSCAPFSIFDASGGGPARSDLREIHRVSATFAVEHEHQSVARYAQSLPRSRKLRGPAQRD